MGFFKNYDYFSYFTALGYFTILLLISVYLIATREKKLSPIFFLIIIFTLILCLIYFIRLLNGQKIDYLFFLETAFVGISIVCVVVLVIIYYFYDDVSSKEENENATFEKDLIELSKNEFITEYKINSNQIKKMDSTKYTYACSVYVKEDAFINPTTEYSKRYLFYRKDDVTPANGHGTNFGIRIGDNRGLYIDYSKQIGATTTFGTALIKSNFPVNALTKLFVTVENTVVNIYIDGIILTKQLKLDNLKQPSFTKPIEFGNMPAYLANFSYSNYVIPPTSSIMEYLSKTNSIHI